MKPESPTLRLKSFTVSDLFGQLNHDIDFHTKERITILHGRNGVGKTTVLRLIAGVFNPHAPVWGEIEFTKVVVKFLPNGTLTIRPNDNDDGSLRYVYKVGKSVHEECDVSPRQSPDFPLGLIEEAVPWLERIGVRRWHDARRGRMIGLDELLARYEHLLPSSGTRPAEIPQWLAQLSGSVSTQFIQTHRLRTEKTAGPRHRRKEGRGHAVADLAESLSTRIRESLRESGSLAASLDRTFPRRLLDGRLPRSASEQAIRERYKEQEGLRERLMAAGLLTAEEGVPLPDAALDKGEQKVLWYYLNDVAEKLQVYIPLLERVELFKSIIDEKDFLYKSMEISQKEGFQFRSDLGEVVPLEKLSSGEQHELVLTYELLFGSRGKQLILIDEPELSLHVTWQRKFLDDMQRIANLADLDFVIATHSPSIVNRRSDLMVELSGKADVRRD